MLRIQDAILYGSKGGSSPSGSIEITENGTYDVTEKAEAVVNVPQPSGTKQVTISQNGTTTEDVEDYENAQITVNVQPNLTTKQITQNGTYPASGDNADGYSSVSVAVPGPSGKITISQNGTDIDVSSYALADVNVSGGASNENAIIEKTISGAYTNNNVTKIGEYVFARSNLTEVYFPNVTRVDGSSFLYCSSLTEVDFPNVTSIGGSAFSGCINLTEVDFPNATIIEGSAFSGCISLTEVDFPNVTFIYNYAFSGCSNLTEVDFLNATRIDNSAFNYCSKLTSLILRGSTIICTLTSTYAFNNTPIQSGTGYIYVPAALIDSYKAATNWNTYAAQFRALEDYTVDGTTTGDLDPTKI